MLTNRLRFQTPTRAHIYQSDEFRQRALERLYERKTAVDALIASLEHYERSKPPQRASASVFSEMPKCS
jgi:hypothetical protein